MRVDLSFSFQLSSIKFQFEFQVPAFGYDLGPARRFVRGERGRNLGDYREERRGEEHVAEDTVWTAPEAKGLAKTEGQ